MNAIVKVLMDRDGMSFDEASDLVRDAKNNVLEGADPEEILYEEFNLEPDYVLDLF